MPGPPPTRPTSAPRAARVNSRTRLSTWDLAASSRSVGTLPSDTGWRVHCQRVAEVVGPPLDELLGRSRRLVGSPGQLGPDHLPLGRRFRFPAGAEGADQEESPPGHGVLRRAGHDGRHPGAVVHLDAHPALDGVHPDGGHPSRVEYGVGGQLGRHQDGVVDQVGAAAPAQLADHERPNLCHQLEVVLTGSEDRQPQPILRPLPVLVEWWHRCTRGRAEPKNRAEATRPAGTIGPYGRGLRRPGNRAQVAGPLA